MPSGEQQIRETKRRYPIGAEWIGENQTHVRVWAPKARELDVIVEYGQNSQRTFHPLSPEQGGYYAGALNVGVDTRYWFRVNSGEKFYPDPASRFQPEGPHGPSCIIDPIQFQWAERPDHLRNAHRHIYQGRHLAGRHRAIGGVGADRNHSGRDDADRGFP